MSFADRDHQAKAPIVLAGTYHCGHHTKDPCDNFWELQWNAPAIATATATATATALKVHLHVDLCIVKGSGKSAI